MCMTTQTHLPAFAGPAQCCKQSFCDVQDVRQQHSFSLGNAQLCKLLCLLQNTKAWKADLLTSRSTLSPAVR